MKGVGWMEGGAGWRGGCEPPRGMEGWMEGGLGGWRAGGADGRLDGGLDEGRLGSNGWRDGLTKPEPKRTARRTAANRANRNRIKPHLKNRNEPKRNAALLKKSERVPTCPPRANSELDMSKPLLCQMHDCWSNPSPSFQAN